MYGIEPIPVRPFFGFIPSVVLFGYSNNVCRVERQQVGHKQSNEDVVRVESFFLVQIQLFSFSSEQLVSCDYLPFEELEDFGRLRCWHCIRVWLLNGCEFFLTSNGIPLIEIVVVITIFDLIICWRDI